MLVTAGVVLVALTVISGDNVGSVHGLDFSDGNASGAFGDDRGGGRREGSRRDLGVRWRRLLGRRRLVRWRRLGGGLVRGSRRAGRGAIRRSGRSRVGRVSIVGGNTSAESDGDLSFRRAGLHAVGIVSRIAVSLLLGVALCAGGSDLPVLVPWVAIDTAQVVPDDPVVVEGVLVLEDVLQRFGLGELDRPAIAIGERSPGLIPRFTSSQSLVFLLVASTRCRDVAQGHIIVALVDDLCGSNRRGHSRCAEKGQR